MKYLFIFLSIIMHSQTSAAPNALKPCPNKPNCVSSVATDEHAIPPFILKKDAKISLQLLSATLKKLETKIRVSHEGLRLHAEISSRIFGFVDDLDLIIDSDQGLLHVRSASRTGHYDFGVNKRRVERLRALLKGEGIIQ